jgi:hypothetical protein
VREPELSELSNPSTLLAVLRRPPHLQELTLGDEPVDLT